MTNFEESAKAYESDYSYAPVGMAVTSFWGGALVSGLVAFVMSCGIAKGFFTPTIQNNSRVLFTDTSKALMTGIGIAVILLAVSILVGLAGYGAVSKKKDLGGLWKLALAVPFLTGLLTIVAIVATH